MAAFDDMLAQTCPAAISLPQLRKPCCHAPHQSPLQNASPLRAAVVTRS
jgi:hypothetical protein